jgi:hypothetical protein
MDYFVEKAERLWDDLFPPVRTPEEVIADEQAGLRDQQNAMMREKWAIEAEMRRADAALKKAAPTRDVDEIRYAATQKVAALQRRADWTEQHNDLVYTQQNLTRMHGDAACTNATLNVMAAVNATSVDALKATRILTHYQMQTQRSDMINELVRETLEQRREEREEARAEKNGAAGEQIERLTQQGVQHGNQLLMHSMPPISGGVLSPGLLAGSKREMREQVREGQRRTDAFLAEGGHG